MPRLVSEMPLAAMMRIVRRVARGVALGCILALLTVVGGVPDALALPPTGQNEATVPLLRRTAHFDVYLASGSLRRAEALRLIARLEPTLEAVAKRFGTRFTARERIYLFPPQRGVCAIRGLTYSAKREIRLYYGPGSDLDRVQALVAHELAHQLQREQFGDAVQRSADIILLEGWATVASDGFARTPDGSEPRWQNDLRAVIANSGLLPLRTDLNRDCRTTTRNVIYDEWASFVHFLELNYGRDALARLYQSSRGRQAGSADYAAIYGIPFKELEAAWRAWVVTQ